MFTRLSPVGLASGLWRPEGLTPGALKMPGPVALASARAGGRGRARTSGARRERLGWCDGQESATAFLGGCGVTGRSHKLGASDPGLCGSLDASHTRSSFEDCLFSGRVPRACGGPPRGGRGRARALAQGFFRGRHRSSHRRFIRHVVPRSWVRASSQAF